MNHFTNFMRGGSVETITPDDLPNTVSQVLDEIDVENAEDGEALVQRHRHNFRQHLDQLQSEADTLEREIARDVDRLNKLRQLVFVYDRAVSELNPDKTGEDAS